MSAESPIAVSSTESSPVPSRTSSPIPSESSVDYIDLPSADSLQVMLNGWLRSKEPTISPVEARIFVRQAATMLDRFLWMEKWIVEELAEVSILLTVWELLTEIL